MKLLVLNWGSYTQPDINESFNKNHISYKQINYFFHDKNSDDFFIRHFTKYLLADKYDAVFSVNYFPLIALACYQQHIKYISWSYDNPLNVPHIETTLHFETNYVFLFDRIQALTYQTKGFNNVYHLPLGVNPQRSRLLSLTNKDKKQYASDISFVGKLYPSTFQELIMPLDDYNKGYLQAIANAQSKVYGYYFIDELLTDSLIQRLNEIYKKSLNSTDFEITKEQLSYSLSTHITREERILLLSLLSKYHQVNIYSPEKHSLLNNANYCGTASYNDSMSKIFHLSKINLNITLKILQSGMPLRSLDILSVGGFLLSNYQIELAENFIEDTDLVFYYDINDALEKAEFYLTHEDIRHQIAQNGYHKALELFNYDKQLAYIFKTVGLN